MSWISINNFKLKTLRVLNDFSPYRDSTCKNKTSLRENLPPRYLCLNLCKIYSNLGPSSSSEARASATIVLSLSQVHICPSSISCSSSISPMTCSIKSSIVTRPSTPPYSSITMLNDVYLTAFVKRTPIVIDAGTYSNGRRIFTKVFFFAKAYPKVKSLDEPIGLSKVPS